MTEAKTDNVVALAHASGRPELAHLIQPDRPSRWTSNDFGALEPPRLNTILLAAQRGDLENWSELASYILRTDPDVRSKWLTRVTSVACSDIEVEPGALPPNATPEMKAAAQAAADFVREEMLNTQDLEDRLADLLHGVGVGVAILEHRWRFEGNAVRTTPVFVHPRDLRYVGNWELVVRTFPDSGREWVAVEEHPNKFIVHKPHNIAERPTLTGELMAIAWPWLFKRWIEKYGVGGFEKLGNGILLGIVEPNAKPAVREAMKDGLENATTNGIGIIERPVAGGNAIEYIQQNKLPGEAAIELIKHYNGEISKGLLGSGLNVEVMEGGGNRALGESQHDVTILPRLISDSKRLAGTIERDWFRPLVQFNTHLFGGRTPPIPRLRFVLVANEVETVAIDELAVNSRVIKKDELRISRGQEPVGPENGGEEFVSPVAKTMPERSVVNTAPAAEPSLGLLGQEGEQRLPFAQSTSPDASPTLPASVMTPLARALSITSDDPEHSQ